ncbi:DUF3224 domain-containing protein, partial [bacterium]|nr:DUF3224 domain-containing protein [bacterium]
MKSTVTGSFEVKMAPLAWEGDDGGNVALGRFALDKKYAGPLTATGSGQMLSARSPVEGSAAYVAIERITGTLEGRRGAFVLQHAGAMGGGAMELTVRVVPDSGTEELAGLTGTMA